MALLPSTKICGTAVTSTDGTALGTITEVMIDHDTGAIGYAVLAHGGVLGVGEKLFAVPWTEFIIDPVAGTLMLNVGPAALDSAAGIDKDAWPAQTPDVWLR
jgi:sporulation protein YlmC with PRC-barrel domain